MARLVGCTLLMLLVSAGLGASGKFQYKDPSILFDVDLYRSTNARMYNRAVRGSPGILAGFSHDGSDGFVWDEHRMALRFDRDGDRGLAATYQIDSTDNFSIVLAFAVTHNGTDRGIFRLFTADSGATNTISAIRAYFYTDDVLILTSRGPSGAANTSLVLSDLSDGNLHFVVYVRSGNDMIAYVDGDSSKSVTIANNIGVIDSLVLGTNLVDQAGSSIYGGKLFSFKTYGNRVLTSNEVSALYLDFLQQGRPGYPVFERPRRRFTRAN